MQRCPFKEAGLVQQQADNDHRDKGRGGVPDDLPDQRNIADLYHSGQQCQQRAETGTPTYAQAFRLPDHQNDRQDKYCPCQHHHNSLVSHIKHICYFEYIDLNFLALPADRP
ncbi:hypothetical protein D3C71_1646890 [compost metagenome]